MTPAMWLRAASVMTWLFAAGHALGGLESWSPVGTSPTLDAMRSFTFDVMGRRRTYLDFYLGFGHYISVLLVLQGVLLWQLAAVATGAAPVRALLASFLVAGSAGAAVVSIYMFAIPIVMSWTIAVCLAMAFRGQRDVSGSGHTGRAAE